MNLSLDPISAAFDFGGKLLDKFIPDPEKKAAALFQLAQMKQNGELAQLTAQTDTNKVEAASTSWFVAGWRPFIGWVCGFGLAYQFITRPIANGIVTMLHRSADFPSLDMGTLLTLLAGMLGLAGARTVEKLNDAAGNH